MYFSPDFQVREYLCIGNIGEKSNKSINKSIDKNSPLHLV